MNSGRHGFWKALGPGLLFAAAAVGVSHLVQSTRAGAAYGLALLGFILLANLAKYPAFRFGPQYAAATGTSLLEGYRRQGRWALVVYGLLTLGTMFTVQAAVTVVTAGLAKFVFGLSASPVVISAVLLVICAAILARGQYRWLDSIVKVLVVILTVSTLLATVLVLPEIDWSAPWFVPVADLDTRTILFIAALVGWMPSAIDISVWQSLWTLARGEETQHRPTVREAMVDFHIGYVGTVGLAICFMLLGVGVMYGSGVEFADSAGGFAAQIIGLYEGTLGEWAGPIIGVSSLAVMFSTTLTVLDGFPRALSTLIERFRTAEESGADEWEEGAHRRMYWASMAVLGCGSILVLFFLLTSLKAMVDIATTISFLTAPLLAVLNHRSMYGEEVPDEARPAKWLWALSWAGIVALSAFAVYYLYLLATT